MIRSKLKSINGKFGISDKIIFKIKKDNCIEVIMRGIK